MRRLKPLLRRQRGLDLEQAESRRRAARPLDAVGIVDGAAEHLIAAAQPEH